MRIHVGYPDITVQFDTRSGSPTFFMHCDCFQMAPVDYKKTGPNAWKEWAPVPFFDVPSQYHIIGIEVYPTTRKYFMHCRINGQPFSKFDNELHSSLKRKRQDLEPVAPVNSKVGSGNTKMPASSHQRKDMAVVPAPSPLTAGKNSLNDCVGNEDEARKQSKILLELDQPQPGASIQKGVASLSSATSMQTRVAPTVADSVRPGLSQSSPVANPKVTKTETESNSDDGSSDTEADDESEADDSDDGAASPVQWSKPGATSQLLGVSASVLRSWADSGAVQTIVSAGGHRLFNVQSVKQHIKASAIKAAEQADQRMKRADEKIKVIVFVKLRPEKLGQGKGNLEQANVAAVIAKMKQHILKSFNPQPMLQQLRASDILVSLVAVKDVHAAVRPSTFADLPHYADLLRLFQTIQKYSRTKVVLQATADISSVPSTYTLFECICKSLHADVLIVPTLF